MVYLFSTASLFYSTWLFSYLIHISIFIIQNHIYTLKIFREIFDSLQFQDFVLIDKIPFYSAFLKAIVLLLRIWIVVNTKNKEIQLKNVWSRRDLNPALQIQSQLYLPLDQSFMKIVKKGGKFWIRCWKIQISNIISLQIEKITLSKFQKVLDSNCH